MIKEKSKDLVTSCYFVYVERRRSFGTCLSKQTSQSASCHGILNRSLGDETFGRLNLERWLILYILLYVPVNITFSFLLTTLHRASLRYSPFL
jgi:hypothetical protein